jgi:hypothetical protein
MRRPRVPAFPLLGLLLACQPATTRPSFAPLPAAEEAVVDLNVQEATTLVAQALKDDSIPVTTVEPRDGYLETGWFIAASGAPTSIRPLGDSVVRVRGWVNAYGKARGSIRVETAVRPLANPALPPRELDRQAPKNNPAASRVARVLEAMARRYPVPGAEAPAVPARPAADSTKPAKVDSTPSPAGQVIEKKRPPMPPGTPPAPPPSNL